MEISERDKREVLASELSDIFHRQEAILQCNEFLKLGRSDRIDDRFRQMAAEDEKLLRLVDSVITGFGLRVPPRSGAMAMADFILEQLQDDSILPLEQLGFYTLMKQSQMMSCHLLHKSAQISEGDIQLALQPLEDVYALIARQVASLGSYIEDFGVEWMTGEKPKNGLIGRARDAFATVSHAVTARSAKPSEEKSILLVLANEHRKIEALFQEILAAESHRRARDLYAQLKADLTAHSIAEEEFVYAHFLASPWMREKMIHSQREHEVMRNLMDEVTYVAGKEEVFVERLENLKDHVEEHVREEESEIFRLMEKSSSEADLIRLSQRFLTEKKAIQINIGTDPVVSSLANIHEVMR